MPKDYPESLFEIDLGQPVNMYCLKTSNAAIILRKVASVIEPASP